MALGIDHCKQLLADLGKLAQDVLVIVKGKKFAEVLGLFKILSDAKAIIADLKASLPELKDLDASEASQLASVAYDMVKKVVESAMA